MSSKTQQLISYDGEKQWTHIHMLSVVVFYYSNTLQIMLVCYTVTEMGFFDDYLDDAPCAKTMRGNGITTFILHVAQCTTFNQT